MQSRNVPCLFGAAPHERGNISYQVLYRALKILQLRREFG